MFFWLISLLIILIISIIYIIFNSSENYWDDLKMIHINNTYEIFRWIPNKLVKPIEDFNTLDEKIEYIKKYKSRKGYWYSIGQYNNRVQAFTIFNKLKMEISFKKQKIKKEIIDYNEKLKEQKNINKINN